MYLAQSFLHALVAALIMDTALLAWNIENPRVRQRFRLSVIILALAAYPCYQLLDPERGSALFRLGAYFDINRWLTLELWGGAPLGIVFLFLLGFTGILFIVQELLPVLRHTATTRHGQLDAARPEPSSAVARALESIPGSRPDVFLLNDPEMLIFSSTGKRPAIYVSPAAVSAFTDEELRAALAHEVGHIRRSRRPVMIMVFLLRVVLFLNPVILMEFRRFIQEEEKICDEVAVELTGNRTAMAGALKKLLAGGETAGPPALPGDAPIGSRIEEYSHTLLIENRIRRLEAEPELEANGAAVFGFALAATLGICYFVV